jgi:hypothetical protein
MNPDIKAEWIRRLRSGEYPQGLCALKSRDGTFCCLGVLCEIAVGLGVIPPPLQNFETGKYIYDGSDMYLSPVVEKWASLSNSAGGYITMNDIEHEPFSRIADFIEEHE